LISHVQDFLATLVSFANSGRFGDVMAQQFIATLQLDVMCDAGFQRLTLSRIFEECLGK
jgi:hypothetical protein